MKHPLHKIIGDLVNSNTFPECKIIKDLACGGGQNIPLFCSREKSNKNEYCNVDLLITVDNEIRVIIEIEEANIKPTQICGKLLTSALSSYFIHKSENNNPVGMADSVLFIQILDTSNLKRDKTSKIEQWKNIEKAIHEIIPVKGSKITNYKLFFGSVLEFKPGNKKAKEFINHIRYFLRR